MGLGLEAGTVESVSGQSCIGVEGKSLFQMRGYDLSATILTFVSLL
jgi:hypothetical protein